MQLLNNTGMLADYTMGMEPSGRESLVVAIKGTFNIPVHRGSSPELLDKQMPLIEADTFHGEPGFSSPRYEVDFAPVKQRCDITMVGSAYASGGKATEQVLAGFRVGNTSKLIKVLGDRYWVASATAYTTSRPRPFVRRTISYNIAFGGIDRFHEDELRHDAYLPNPVGIGFHRYLSDKLVNNTLAPSTEEPDVPVTRPDGQYKPMSFGPLGRGWQARLCHAGTYDSQWQDNTFPFLPDDFNPLYYQCAPTDQQGPFLNGGEVVSLLNVTEDGKRSFEIPRINVPVVFFRSNGEREKTQAILDTLVLEPDDNRFTLTWRASVMLNNNPFEVPEALIGTASRAWWRARDVGKTHYPSLDALPRANFLQDADEPDDSSDQN